MKSSFLLAAAIVTAAISFEAPAFAQSNRTQEDAIFNHPPRSGGVQVFLGIAELFLAFGVAPGTTQAQDNASKAELKLAVAEKVPTSSKGYRELYRELSEMSSDALDDTQEKLLETLKQKRGPFTEADRVSMITSAQEEVAQARARVISEMASTTRGQQLIRTVRVLGASVLVLDTVGRIYVWHSLDADPTFSPTITYLQSILRSGK